MEEKIKQYINSLEKDSIPQLSVNCVIFGFHEKSLQVIVNKVNTENTELLLLPGGYVKQKENLDDAVVRIVKESTGLEKILLKQFDVFGKASRSFGKEFIERKMLSPSTDQSLKDWFTRRFVSIGYLALVDFNSIDLKPTQFLDAAQWLPINKIKSLAMDHTEIALSALASLRKEMPYAPIASNLLPSKFTLPDLLSLVESILGRKVDRANFRRKILGTKMIVKVGSDKSGNRRPADLYKFKNGKKTSLIDDFKFGF